MRWEDHLAGVFEDLEQQAEGLHLSDRDGDLADRSRGEYATVRFDARVHASVGRRPVGAQVRGLGRLDGVVTSAGVGWFSLASESSRHDWVVSMAAVTAMRGLSDQASIEGARPVLSRLSLGSVLRGCAESRSSVTIHSVDGTQFNGLIGRVGVDFVEVVPPAGVETARTAASGAWVVPFHGLATVRRTELR